MTQCVSRFFLSISFFLFLLLAAKNGIPWGWVVILAKKNFAAYLVKSIFSMWSGNSTSPEDNLQHTTP